MQPTICIVSPDLNGGIRRLFDDMSLHSRGDGLTKLDWFVSTSAGIGSVLNFPGRLLHLLGRAAHGRYDLYHFNLASKGSTLRKVLYSFPLRAFRQPYVLHLHGASFREFYSSLPGLLRMHVQSFFLGASKVIVLGRVWQDFVVQDIGVPLDRVVILANAVAGPDILPVPNAAEMPKLLFLGRLGARKGVPELLDALARPEMSALEWTATIAGDGDVEACRKRAADLGLSHRVSFPGWVSGTQVSALLGASHILVLPSHAENLPLSMLEGMGYGLCPVVTPVGAVEDVIRNEENGLLVPVGDVEGLSRALVRVCTDDEFRRRLASQARADFLTHYDIRHYRARLEAIYLDVLASGH